MVRLSAGDKKKLLIVETCKKLFYNKGYSNTTYDDICTEADIPPGSITYHFDGKRGIASVIEDEFERQNKIYIEKMCGGRFTKTQLMVIENFNMWRRQTEDANLRHFILNMSTERIPSNSALEAVTYFYQCVIDDQKITGIDDKELHLIAAAQIGMSDSLFLAYAAHPEYYSYEYMARFAIRFFMRQIGIPDGKIQEFIEDGWAIYQTLPIDNRYFKEFAYNEKYLKRLK